MEKNIKPRFYAIVIELKSDFADAVNGDLLHEMLPELAEVMDQNNLRLVNHFDQLSYDLDHLDLGRERTEKIRALMNDPVAAKAFKEAFWLIGRDNVMRFDGFKTEKIFQGLSQPAVSEMIHATQRYIYPNAA